MNKQLVKTIKSEFKKFFSSEPLMVFAPGRINLIGEHTDYNNGFVLPAAIDKGIVVAIQKCVANITTIIAHDVDERYDFSLNTIQPIANGGWKNYVLGVIGELQKTGKHIENFNLVFGGDIPKGAGLSSSAALENSVVFAINELFNLGLSKTEMIFVSQKAEHNYVGVKCGIMDQYTSMFGKKNAAILLDCENLEAKPIQINLQQYQLLLINTNVNHNLANSAYNERRVTCENVSKKLGITSLRHAHENQLFNLKNELTELEYQNALFVIQENQRVIDAFNTIKNENISGLGTLLFESHAGLQYQYNVSCTELDFLVEKAKESRVVVGARMMGGGFGGCTINLVETNKLEKFKDQITTKYNQKFNTTCSFYNVKLSEGTILIS